MAGPLAGYRVVEATVALQGPAAGLYLAQMGADVVKVEPPAGDSARTSRGVGNHHPPEAPGPLWVAANRGKRSVTLDAGSPRGREVLARLVERADVFLSNYREEALERMGLGYSALRTRNPRLVYATVNGFGRHGPQASKAMLDGAAQARAGLPSLTGDPELPPTLVGPAVADAAGAMQFALGIVTALVARERTGVGQRVHTSGYGAQLWLQMWELQQCAQTGRPLRRAGAHHPNVAGTYGLYRTADDDWLFLAVPLSEPAWQRFWAFAGAPELGTDPRWNTAAKRLGRGSDPDGWPANAIRPLLRDAFAKKPMREWCEFLNGEPEFIWERVHEHDEVLRDPQAQANGYIAPLDVPGLGPTQVVGSLVELTETPGVVGTPPPALGEHTAEVLREVGYDDAVVDEVTAQTARARDALRRPAGRH